MQFPRQDLIIKEIHVHLQKGGRDLMLMFTQYHCSAYDECESPHPLSQVIAYARRETGYDFAKKNYPDVMVKFYGEDGNMIAIQEKGKETKQ